MADTLSPQPFPFSTLISDIGNVVIAYSNSPISPENFDTIDYNAIPEVPDAFAVLAKYHERLPGGAMVVCNSTLVADTKIRAWLDAHSFWQRTGIPPARVVRSHVGRDKTGHLSPNSEVASRTVVVDDRLEVLAHFVGRTRHLFLFRPNPAEVARHRITGALRHVIMVDTWLEIDNILAQSTA